MNYYVCIHDSDAYLREAVMAGIKGVSPGIRIGPRVALERGREVYAIDAGDAQSLRSLIDDLNMEWRRECAHQVPNPQDRSSCAHYNGSGAPHGA